MNDIITMKIGDSTVWIHQEEYNIMKKWEYKMKKAYFHTFGNPVIVEIRNKRSILNMDNRVWAYIIVGKTRMMAWVDKLTGKAYKADGYKKTWIEIKKYKFERFCTTFDL